MEIANIIILAASLTTAVGVIITSMTNVFNKAMNPINKKIDAMDERQCKAFLVDFLNGVEVGEKKDEVQYELAYEVYDHYTNDLHCNSYIHNKWERVMKPK